MTNIQDEQGRSLISWYEAPSQEQEEFIDHGELFTLFLQVKQNKKQYTARDVKRADRARKFQHITGQPVKIILHEDDSNILHKFPILQEDVEIAEDIYGPSVPYLQVKNPPQSPEYGACCSDEVYQRRHL